MIEASLRAAAARLEASSDTPRLDADLLLAHALGITRERLLLGEKVEVIPDDFDTMVARRARGEPIAYILGRRDFWTIDLDVGPGVLIPRPDSETLLDAAVEHFEGRDAPRSILDLGTGPGSLLLAALAQWPGASGVGVDASSAALDYARVNAARLGMEERSRWRLGDWGEGLSARFDLILCNPPYVAEGDDELDTDVEAFEPREALMAGPEGLDAYRVVIPQLGDLLSAGGLAVLEIGHRQAAPVRALFEAQEFEPRLYQDLAGRDRAFSVTGR